MMKLNVEACMDFASQGLFKIQRVADCSVQGVNKINATKSQLREVKILKNEKTSITKILLARNNPDIN